MKALVVGGGGPTGPYIIEGLRARGYQTAVLNRGVHPVEAPGDVERIVGDPHFLEPLREAVVGRTFDVVVASYGRLGVVAEAFSGLTGRFIGVGGFVAYRGFYEPQANSPPGLPIPTAESAPLVRDAAEHRFSALVAAAEDKVFANHPRATIFRYPYVYGPRQLVPREWSIVRRVLDGRATIPVLHGGRVLQTHGYAENLAHAVMLAIDNPERAGDQAYNCGDLVQFDLRQLIEASGAALGAEIEIVSLPDSPATRSVLFTQVESHRLMDLHKIRTELGYTDVVSTAEAVARTVRWYADHPLERGGEIERKMFDAFDYATEDRLIALYRDFQDSAAAVQPAKVNDAHPYAHPKAAGAGPDQRGR